MYTYRGNLARPAADQPEPPWRRRLGPTMTVLLAVLIVVNAVGGTTGALLVRPSRRSRPVVVAGQAVTSSDIAALARPPAEVLRAGAATGPPGPGAAIPPGPAIPAPSPLRTLVPQVTPEGAPRVALTFDDGPDPRWTPAILQILREEGTVATFCTVGTPAAAHPDLVRAQVAQGHGSCGHTVHHDNHLDRRPPPVITAEMYGQADLFQSITGVGPRYFRAPGGNLSAPMVEMAHARGMQVLHWSADVPEFWGASAAHMLPRLLASVHPGAVVLLHDGGGDRSATVAMVRPLIHYLKARGFVFTVP